MEFVSWDDDIPKIWTNKSHVPNHQPGHQCWSPVVWLARSSPKLNLVGEWWWDLWLARLLLGSSVILRRSVRLFDPLVGSPTAKSTPRLHTLWKSLKSIAFGESQRSNFKAAEMKWTSHDPPVLSKQHQESTPNELTSRSPWSRREGSHRCGLTLSHLRMDQRPWGHGGMKVSESLRRRWKAEF